MNVTLPNGRMVKTALARRDLLLMAPGAGGLLHGYASRASGDPAISGLGKAMTLGAIGGVIGGKVIGGGLVRGAGGLLTLHKDPGIRMIGRKMKGYRPGLVPSAALGSLFGGVAHVKGRVAQRFLDVKSRRVPFYGESETRKRIQRRESRKRANLPGAGQEKTALSRRDLFVVSPVSHGYITRAAGEPQSAWKPAATLAIPGALAGAGTGALYGGTTSLGIPKGLFYGGLIGAGAGAAAGAAGHGLGRFYQRYLDAPRRRVPLFQKKKLRRLREKE